MSYLWSVTPWDTAALGCEGTSKFDLWTHWSSSDCYGSIVGDRSPADDSVVNAVGVCVAGTDVACPIDLLVSECDSMVCGPTRWFLADKLCCVAVLLLRLELEKFDDIV